MSSPEISESADANEPKKVTFGKILLQARERKGYTLAEVAKATHLDESVIDAIEQSDMNRLPPPTFVQGYLRTYARYLELPEQKIVDDFNHAVPYKRVSQLYPRSTMPPQVDLRSPWVRGISIALVCLVLVALIYGGYGYYKRAVKTISRETATTVTLKPAEQKVSDKNAPLPANAESNAGTQLPDENNKSEQQQASTKTASGPGQQAISTSQTPVSDAANTAGSAATKAPETGTDVLDLTASDDSWVEISDATGHRLYHDLLQKGQALHLKGKAPFDVFLGNAPAVDLRVNGVQVKMDGRIRSNKVAHFSVTTSEGNVVFR